MYITLIKERLRASASSQNFFVNLLTVLFVILNYNGAGIPEGLSESIVDAFKSGDLTRILIVAIPSLINPILTIIRNKAWSWGFLKSQNFWIQAFTVAIVGFTALGAVFPNDAAASLINAIFGGNIQAILAAAVINIVNPILYIFLDHENQGSPVFRRLGNAYQSFKKAA